MYGLPKINLTLNPNLPLNLDPTLHPTPKPKTLTLSPQPETHLKGGLNLGTGSNHIPISKRIRRYLNAPYYDVMTSYLGSRNVDVPPYKLQYKHMMAVGMIVCVCVCVCVLCVCASCVFLCCLCVCASCVRACCVCVCV